MIERRTQSGFSLGRLSERQSCATGKRFPAKTRGRRSTRTTGWIDGTPLADFHRAYGDDAPPSEPAEDHREFGNVLTPEAESVASGSLDVEDRQVPCPRLEMRSRADVTSMLTCPPRSRGRQCRNALRSRAWTEPPVTR
jgi:hypothetical protein